MKLNISNFRTIEKWNGIFHSGMTLLKGPSGQGKSTLLEAIRWCLYGHLKQVYPLNGEKRTEVELTINDILITRKKNPEILIFTKNEITCQGEAAQSEIDNIFGSRSLWQSSSYMMQGERILLLAGSQQDKNQLIKELVFSNKEETSETYLTFFKERINYLQQNNKNYIYMLDTINDKIKNFESEHSQLLDKLNLKFKKSKLYKNKDLLKNKYIEKKELIQNYREQEKINEIIEEKKIKYQTSKEKIKKFPPQLNQKIFLDWQRYNDLKNELQQIDTKDDIIISSSLDELLQKNSININNLDIMKKYNIESEDIPNEILKLEIEIKQYYEYEQYQEIYKLYSDKQSKIDKYQIYEKKLEAIEDNIIRNWKFLLTKLGLEYRNYEPDYLILVKERLSFFQSACFQCPKCHVKLNIKGEKLVINDNNFSSQDFDKLNKLIITIKQFYDNLLDCQQNLTILSEKHIEEPRKIEDPGIKDIGYLEKKYYRLKEYENLDFKDIKYKIKLLKCREFASTLLEEKNKKYHAFFDHYNIEGDDYFSEFITAKNIIFNYEKEKERYRIIDKLCIEKEENLLSSIKEKLDIINEQEAIWNYKEKLDAIKNEYTKEKDKYENTCEEIKKCEKIIKIIRISEHESFQQFINYFNTLVNDILCILFDNCYINMKSFKEDDKNNTIKSKIEIHIFLEGHKYENWHLLSGGEKDRLGLAITLSLNYIRQNPILMVDECMASLDACNREKCLKAIKKYAFGKRIINICHETIEGFYDQVIEF